MSFDQEETRITSEEATYDLEKAYKMTGGFGTAQKIAFVCLMVTRNMGLAYMYVFSLLILEQPYECRTEQGDFRACFKQEICANQQNPNFEYQLDRSYAFTLENWFTQLNWICTPTYSIDLIATLFFIGLGAGAFLISWLPEKIGRKPTLLLTGAILTPCHFALLYWPNTNVKIVCYGVMGFLYIGKTVCLNLMYELSEKKHTPLICNIFHVWDWGSAGLMCISMWVCRSWVPLFTVYTWFGAICLLVYSVFLPESPKFLLMTGEKTKAIDALNQLARINGSLIRFNYMDSFVEEEGVKIKRDQSNLIEEQPTTILHHEEDEKFVRSQSVKFPYGTFFQLLLLNICGLASYWLAQISATQLAGNKFLNVLLVCCGEVSGVMLAGFLHQKKMPDNLTNQLFCLVVITTVFFQYMLDQAMPQGSILSYFLVVILFNAIGGMCYQGFLFPITRIPPKYLAPALTQFYGLGCLCTSICPILTRKSRLV